MSTEYFSRFPKIVYNGDKITNLTIRLDFINRIKNNVAIFQYIQLQDGQRPEDIAYDLYNDPTLYWIILWLNDIIDPYYDWLLTQKQVYEYALSQYSDINAIHHYETNSNSPLGAGVIVNSTDAYATAVTNISYEQTQNELKRKIKVVKGQYITQILSEYATELNKNS